MQRALLQCLALGFAVCIAPARAVAQQTLVIKPLAERKVSELPPGELFWRIENFDSLADASATAGPWSLVAESAGKVWLFTPASSGNSSPKSAKVAEVGPIPRINATKYLLRINDASGPPGSETSVHSHPGSEAFFVLTGKQRIRGAHRTLRVKAGQAEAGQGAEKAMQVSSSGTTDLHALVMFVLDADKPFSSPATLQ